MPIIDISGRDNQASCPLGTSRDLAVTVDGVEISGVESIKVHDIDPECVVKATITCMITLGKGRGGSKV